MSSIECIIFDCDGVLIDSEVISARIMIEELLLEDIDVDFAYFKANFLGRGFAKVSADIRANFGKAISEDFEVRYRRKLLDAFENELQPMPGIFEVLNALNLPYCVATSSGPARVESSLRITGLTQYFADNVFTASQVKNGKPAPDLFLFAAEKMQIAPAHCLVIEDSKTGLEAAIRAQMQVWHFTGGSHLKDQILRHEAELQTFDNWAIFPDMLQRAIGKQAHVREN